MEKYSKYLGLPTIIGHSKKEVFQVLVETVWKKVQRWKDKLLSRPGREVLIKAVIQAIATYMMSIFSLSDDIISQIHSLMGRFWWGAKGDKRKMHWHN